MRLPESQFLLSSWWLRIAAVLVGLSVYHLVTEELDFAENYATQMVLAVVASVSLSAYLWRSLHQQVGEK